MAEPTRADTVESLSNVVRTTCLRVRFRLPAVHIFPALLAQGSPASERSLAFHPEARAAFQHESGLTCRRDQDEWPYATHPIEVMKVDCLASARIAPARILAENVASACLLTAIRIGTLADLQPPYSSSNALSPVLLCAHA
jgi:hypothetical protein